MESMSKCYKYDARCRCNDVRIRDYVDVVSVRIVYRLALDMNKLFCVCFLRFSNALSALSTSFALAEDVPAVPFV